MGINLEVVVAFIFGALAVLVAFKEGRNWVRSRISGILAFGTRLSGPVQSLRTLLSSLIRILQSILVYATVAGAFVWFCLFFSHLAEG